MKYSIFILIFSLLSAQNVTARYQVGHEKYQQDGQKPPTSPLRIIAGLCIPVGCIGVGGGIFICGMGRDNRGLIMTGAGAGFIALSTYLFIYDASKHRKHKLSIISAQSNELGVAYNFR